MNNRVILLPLLLIASSGLLIIQAADNNQKPLSKEEKTGYSIGYDIGSNLLPVSDKLDLAMFRKGLEDGLQKRESILSDEAMDAAKAELLRVMAKARNKPSSMIGKQAPSWDVDQWRNLDKKKSLNIENLKGKVVYLYCFQSWCPGCHSLGFPTMVELIRKYQNDDKVAFVTVQTVFEGHHVNTPEAAWKTAEKYKLTIPVGHSGSKSTRSKIMAAYKTRGTPWTIIIGPDGIVKYSDFRISVDVATKLIDKLKTKDDSKPKDAVDKK